MALPGRIWLPADSGGREWACAAGPAGVCVARVGQGGFGFDVFGIGRDALDAGAGGVQRGGAQALARAELRDVAGEEPRDLDHRLAILVEGGHRNVMMMVLLLAACDGLAMGALGSPCTL